jgi:DNA primase large subunit
MRSMRLPPGWWHYMLERAGCEHCLYNVWSVDSEIEFRRLQSWPHIDRERFLEGWPHIAERAAEEVAKRIAYRDLDEAGKLREDIRAKKVQISLLSSAGTSSALASIKEAAAKITVMTARLTEIEAVTKAD